jgi:WXG100 family type VII secretion target
LYGGNRGLHLSAQASRAVLWGNASTGRDFSLEMTGGGSPLAVRVGTIAVRRRDAGAKGPVRQGYWTSRPAHTAQAEKAARHDILVADMTTPPSSEFPNPIQTGPDGNAISGGVHYRVTPEYLAQAMKDTYNTANTVSDQLNELRSYVNWVEEVWGGVAYDTFNTLMQEWNNYSTMLNNALMDIAKGLDGTYVNYVDSEVQNIKNLESLGASVPVPPTGTNFD